MDSVGLRSKQAASEHS